MVSKGPQLSQYDLCYYRYLAVSSPLRKYLLCIGRVGFSLAITVLVRYLPYAFVYLGFYVSAPICPSYFLVHSLAWYKAIWGWVIEKVLFIYFCAFLLSLWYYPMCFFNSFYDGELWSLLRLWSIKYKCYFASISLLESIDLILHLSLFSLK